MAHEANCRQAWGNVFNLEELRQMVGLLPSAELATAGEDSSPPATTPPAAMTNAPRNVVLVGHNFKGDFDCIDSEIGFDLIKQNAANVLGVLDTQVLAQKAGVREPALRKLINHYNIHPMHETITRKGMQTDFKGAHNAGNDAIATLQLALGMGHDYDTPSYSGNLDPKETPEGQPNPHPFKDNVILVAMDLEHQDCHTRKLTEVGIAWLDLSEVQHLPYEEWNGYVHARHLRVADLCWWVNRNWSAGNPEGFWVEYNKFGWSEKVKMEDIAFRLDQQFRDFSRKPIVNQKVATHSAKEKVSSPSSSATIDPTTSKTVDSGSSTAHSRDSSTSNINTDSPITDTFPAEISAPLKVDYKYDLPIDCTDVIDHEAEFMAYIDIGRRLAWDLEYEQEHALRSNLRKLDWARSKVEAVLDECRAQRMEAMRISRRIGP